MLRVPDVFPTSLVAFNSSFIHGSTLADHDIPQASPRSGSSGLVVNSWSTKLGVAVELRAIHHVSASLSFPYVRMTAQVFGLLRFREQSLIFTLANATGNGWEDAFSQAADFVNQLTLEEKVQLVTGTPGPCIGNIAPIDRLGFRGLCLQVRLPCTAIMRIH